MKPIDRTLVLGVAAAALAGCGSSPTKSSTPATANAACVQLHTAAAARAVRCNGGAAADWAAYETAWDDCTTYDRHVAERRVEYRRDLFEACVAEYESACDHTFNCFYEVLHGVVADGQHCQDTEVCGTNSACFLVSAQTCGEVCVRGGVENEACGIYCGAGGAPCLDFPLCRYDLFCVNNVCVTPKPLGATCGPADPIPCALPGFCTADPADPQSTGTCARPGSEPCRADSECPATAYCLQGTCTARRALGAACQDAPTSCEAWTTCGAGGTCVPAGKPGGACLLFNGQPGAGYCLIGACTLDNVCVAFATPGQSCQLTTCVTGSSCDPATLTCVACNP
jgi:hypothetical protein